MKANTSYHDLIGTIEADIAYKITRPHNDPKLFHAMVNYGIDPEKFRAVGLHFYSGFRKGKIHFTLFLERKLNDGAKELRKMPMTLPVAVFFGLFERLDIYLMDQFFKHDHLYGEQIEEIDPKEVIGKKPRKTSSKKRR